MDQLSLTHADRRARSASFNTNMLPPYSTLGQLSYAPTTQTTVVTTTTTTTTSFPPLLIHTPRHLSERDPRLYPLASLPTPQFIRKLSFDINGRPAYFEEAPDPVVSYKEHHQRYVSLQASNGVTRSVQEHGTHYEIPTSAGKLETSCSASRNISAASTTQQKKRSVSPISIAEAATRASRQRGNKRPRMSLDCLLSERAASISGTGKPRYRELESTDSTEPRTPDTDLGDHEIYGRPRSRKGLDQTGQGCESADIWRKRRRTFPEKAFTRPISGRSDLRSEKLRMVESPNASEASDTDVSPSSLSKSQIPGATATPPIVETDFEAIVPTHYEISQQDSTIRPSVLDTTSAQDASLPSPSLSPITAAANLASHGSFKDLLNESGAACQVRQLSEWDNHQSRRGISDVRTTTSRDAASNPTRIDIPATSEVGLSNAQLQTPTLMDIPTMIASFDAMPDQMKTYVMYQFLRRCAKPTLHFVADVVNPTLKCDFIARLPLELSFHIIQFLDARTMCRAAQVSKKWRAIIDSDEKAWKGLLDKDGYVLPEGELERAVREGWGWQCPYRVNDWERDISNGASWKADSGTSTGASPASAVPRAGMSELVTSPQLTSSAKRRKRAVACDHASSKRHKKSNCPAESSSTDVGSSFASAHGPHAYADVAALAVPNPDSGLPGLDNLHLFKTLYARHHMIRQSWMEERTKPRHIAFRAHQRHVVTCLQFDSDKILTGSDDTNINVYDTKTGALRARLEGHEGGVWALEYHGNTLVSGSTDRSVRIWNIEKGKCLHVFQGHTSTVRCLQIVHPKEIGKNMDGTPIMMPKQALIITGSRDSTLRLWKLPQPWEHSVCQAGPSANDHDNPYFLRTLTGHHHSVRAIAAYADTLVSGSYDCTVRVWKISTGEMIHRLTGHSQKVYSVVLDYKRSRCISGSMDNLVKVWSLETGSCLFNLEGHTSLVGLLDLSSDRLVSAAADSTLRIWDPENGQCKSTLTAHTGAITCFQHDGQKVISGSDRTLKMWNIKTGECMKDLLTDLTGVWQVKFDDRRCVAAVQRHNLTYIEVLDFGASRDGVPDDQRGKRIHVDVKGTEVQEVIDLEADQP